MAVTTKKVLRCKGLTGGFAVRALLRRWWTCQLLGSGSRLSRTAARRPW